MFKKWNCKLTLVSTEKLGPTLEKTLYMDRLSRERHSELARLERQSELERRKGMEMV